MRLKECNTFFTFTLYTLGGETYPQMAYVTQ